MATPSPSSSMPSNSSASLSTGNESAKDDGARKFLRSPVPGRLAAPVVLAASALLLLLVIVYAAGSGAYAISAAEIIAILAGKIGISINVPVTAQQEGVLMAIRLPRVLLGVLVGGALGMAGAALQGLFRNPLADPQLIGVSGGAAFSVASVIVLGSTALKGLSTLLGAFTLPVAGFAGGMATTFLLYRMAQHEGRTSLVTMLLAGIAINAIAFSGIGYYSFLATDEQLRNLTFWSFGSLGGATWTMLAAISVPLLFAFAWLARLAPGLNALLLGNAEAMHLGYDTQRLNRTVIVLAALCTGFCVSVSGLIGFVALVAPHVVRLLCGPDHRIVLPGAALLGASLLILADVVARTAVAPAELPIGVITAFMGGPFFILLLIRQRRFLAGN